MFREISCICAIAVIGAVSVIANRYTNLCNCVTSQGHFGEQRCGICFSQLERQGVHYKRDPSPPQNGESAKCIGEGSSKNLLPPPSPPFFSLDSVYTLCIAQYSIHLSAWFVIEETNSPYSIPIENSIPAN